jgi:hypothetical protein
MKARRVAAITLLGVLSGSGWLLQAYPGTMGFPFAGFMHFAVICLAGAVVWLVSGRERLPLGAAAGVLAAGSCIFVLPGIVLHAVAGAVSDVTGVVIFCSIPALTVLASAALGRGGREVEGARTLLPASLLGLGGAMLLLPLDIPRSAQGWFAVAALEALCAFIALAGIAMNGMMRRVPVPAAILLVGAGGVLALGCCGLFAPWPEMSLRTILAECVRCAAFDLPLVWLSVWLIREVEPVRLAARFILSPLVTAAEGFAGMRGGVGIQGIAGMILMAAASLLLMLRRTDAEVEGLKLR